MTHSFIMIVQRSKYPQMGPLYLSSALLGFGIETYMIGSNATTEELDELIGRVDPIAVGCSVMTAPEIAQFIAHSLHVQEKYNGHRKRLPVIWGGMHSTIVWQQTVEESYIDYVVSGEAEVTLPEILLGIIDGRYPEEKLIRVATPSHLDDYQPNWGDVDVTTFLFPESHSVHADVDFESGKKDIFYYLLSSRGCTYKCNFCWEVARTATLRSEQRASGTGADLSWRSHSLAWVEAQLDAINVALALSGRTMDGVGLWDDMIFGRGNSAHIGRAHSILSYLRDRNFGYLLEARADQLIRRTDRWNGKGEQDADLYHFLKETGCMQVFVGTESASQATLNMIQKGTKVADYMRLVELSHQVGLPLRFSMIVGFPEETDDSVNQTLDLIEALEEEPYVSVSGPKLFTPYPGVPQFDAAVSRGLVVPADTLGWAYLDRYADYRGVYPWLEENLRPATLKRIDAFFQAVSAEKKHIVDEERVRELVRSH
jgi:anaerobic magnesium-protoporphyrin IX monomethyl ester cyclase